MHSFNHPCSSLNLITINYLKTPLLETLVQYTLFQAYFLLHSKQCIQSHSENTKRTKALMRKWGGAARELAQDSQESVTTEEGNNLLMFNHLSKTSLIMQSEMMARTIQDYKSVQLITNLLNKSTIFSEHLLHESTVQHYTVKDKLENTLPSQN